METFTYFAYGSNMLTERLRERCPRAEAIGTGWAPKYRLAFSKQSIDGSGKATLVQTSNADSVHGVLFRIPKSERPVLDDAEGTDYRRDDNFVVIRSDDGSAVTASAYLAKIRAMREGLRPYDWYRDLILEGAKQHFLPPDYQIFLSDAAADPDPIPIRKTRQKAVALLNRCWEATLPDSDRNVLRVARKLYAALPISGACYRTSFFLAYYLKQRLGIIGTAQVGFVNDGTDDLYSSHAWYVLNDRITDLGISRPLEPELQKKGPLTVLGRELQPGWTWTYHTERSIEGSRAINQLMENPRTRPAVAAGEDLHRAMVTTSQSDERIRLYLDGAPDGLTYEVLASRVS